VISSSPTNYSYLQIERPVIAGGREFLVQAREIGRRVLGEHVVTSITEFAIPQETVDGEQPFGPAEIITPIETPNMILAGEAKDLKLVLLHRAVPNDIAQDFNFGRHEARFRTGLSDYQRVDNEGGGWQHERYEEPTLKDELDAISVAYHAEIDNLSLVFDRVGVIGEPGNDLIFGLFPREEQIGTFVLHKQAKLCFERLAAQSTRLAYPTSPWSLNVPFARVPGNITQWEYQRLSQGLHAQMPLRLGIGGIAYVSRDRF